MLWQTSEIEIFGFLGAEPVIPTLEYAGVYVSSVIHGSQDIYLLDSYSSGSNFNLLSVEGNTNKLTLYRDDVTGVPGAPLIC